MQHTITDQKTKKQNGYILIETAFVMVVLSVLIAVSIPLYNSYETRNAINETKQRMDIVSRAFSTYAQTYSRLPCPADSSSALAPGGQLGMERAACITASSEAHGIVPYRTLGIPEQYAKDGYGNFFTYTVSPDFTVNNRLGIQNDAVHLRLSHLVGGDDTTGDYALLPRAQFCAPLFNNGTDIIVNDENGQLSPLANRVVDITPRPNFPVDPNLMNITTSNANRDLNVTTAAMAIISHGANGLGAYQSNGTQPDCTTATGAENVTCDPNNSIIDIRPDWVDAGAGMYDDIVVFYTQDQIYAAAGSNSCEHL